MKRLQIVADNGLGFTPSFSTTPSSLFDNPVEEALANPKVTQPTPEDKKCEQKMWFTPPGAETHRGGPFGGAQGPEPVEGDAARSRRALRALEAGGNSGSLGVTHGAAGHWQVAERLFFMMSEETAT